ncbi:MAG: hypothetical protein M1450_02780 [Patescibacteria group bacterium]|nr:hypothetical protein [Patescibacteria group bacterium]
MAAQKIKASTQKFIEIRDIVDDIVILNGGNACLVIEVQAVNFALLSRDEQDTRIFSYASLLNSLSFPVEIIIQNKRIDVSSYLKLLEQEAERKASSFNANNTNNEKLLNYIKLYREFVAELVKVNSVLDKKFYMVIPYSYLEKGIGAATGIVKQKNSYSDKTFSDQAKNALHTKANALHAQLGRLSLKARTLEKEDLIKLFYSIYNQDSRVESPSISTDIKIPIVKAAFDTVKGGV